jgi:hypothetical protein
MAKSLIHITIWHVAYSWLTLPLMVVLGNVILLHFQQLAQQGVQYRIVRVNAPHPARERTVSPAE